MSTWGSRRAGQAAIGAVALIPVAGLLVFLVYPLLVIAAHSLRSGTGVLSVTNYTQLAHSPAMLRAAWHSVAMSTLVTLASLLAGFVIAFALYRSRMPGKWLVHAVLLLPMLAPSLVQGLGLIFLLGRSGLVHRWTGWNLDIYGLPGLLLANVFYALPQVVIIVSASLSRVDRRYYDSAEMLGASRWRQFVDVTLPNARFGLLSAAFVVFTVTMTDFGNAIVLGGSYRVLATEIYSQVAGQMNMGAGAAIGMVLLLPAVLSVYVERVASRRELQVGLDAAMAVVPARNRGRDIALTLAVAACLVPVLATVLVVVYASFVKLWPYRLGLTLANYHASLTDGVAPLLTSLKVSLATGLLGTMLLFVLAMSMRSLRGVLARVAWFAALLPAAIPGMVLGIGFLLAFNTGPLASLLYGTAAIVVLCNFYHYHSQAFLTMVAGLRTVPAALEEAVACLGAGRLRRIGDVVLPYAASSMLAVFFFLFMRSMVTLAGVIFLVTPTLKLASVSVMQMDMNGSTAQAAAYATCVMVVVGMALLAMRLAVGGIALKWKRSRHVA
jgi:iron(III) transport system permease protein